MAKKYLSKEINFNVAPVMWQGLYTFPGPNGSTSNFFTGIIAVKHPLEVIIPDFYCQGNSYIGGNKDIKGSLVVGQISAEVAVEAAPEPPYGGDGTIVILATVPRINLEDGDIWATGNITAEKDMVAWGEVYSGGGAHRLSAKKNFDIPHPTKEGWRLTHSCLEGPEAAVYVRGKLINENIIKLPEYWEKLVDPDTITVSITPIGSYQDIFVKHFDATEIILQSKENTSINCFYHIFGERIDTEKLIAEYEGSIEDYPGDNSERSIVGYHYDKKVI
jgi:hypothetical protein